MIDDGNWSCEMRMNKEHTPSTHIKTSSLKISSKTQFSTCLDGKLVTKPSMTPLFAREKVFFYFFHKTSYSDSFYRFLMQIHRNSNGETIKLKHLSVLSVVVPHSRFRFMMECFSKREKHFKLALNPENNFQLWLIVFGCKFLVVWVTST